jgi:hypothetical protein
VHPDAARAQLRAHDRVGLRAGHRVQAVEDAGADLGLVEAFDLGLVDERVSGRSRSAVEGVADPTGCRAEPRPMTRCCRV